MRLAGGRGLYVVIAMVRAVTPIQRPRYRGSARAVTTHRVRAQYAVSAKVPLPNGETTAWTAICQTRLPVSTTVSRALR
jgi:hypothetical protein